MRVQEKVEARQSAGEDAARTRVGNRLPEQPRLSDEDKEAARALLRKKKRKEEEVPFYRQGWFSIISLVTLLVFIGIVIYLVFVRRPGAEELYSQAKAMLDTDDMAKWKEAREGPIKDYLSYYGNRDDEQTKKVKGWADQVDAQLYEHWLVDRLNRDWRVGVDADEETFRQGVKDENEGKLASARGLWNKLNNNKESADEDKRKSALVAQNRLKQLDEVAALEKKMRVGKNLTDSKEKEVADWLKD